MADPLVYVDYEFGFTHGDPQWVTILVGRDTITIQNDSIAFEVREDPDAIESLTVMLASVSYQRTTRRTVQPEKG